ncbi:MAG: aminotransferase class V-fold PLP-dependent enzyme [Actinomyces sp.]|nr:aminotransferase class V-fold PLP-dependent enzyme [Actinomyces sp.]MCI1690471.1 aminotransferase class V-fold PLP-dependent enzyme [Actinomyces sp.]MCI1786451.1 aminotransferase class V-fold PLP-dependent enzyme [Actinomyces sp.]
MHAGFFSYLRTGDRVVVADVAYEATWRLFAELLPERDGIQATFVDASDLEAVRAAIRPNIRLVPVEAIANPTTKVTDIPSVAQVAREAGALLVADSAFTPPPLYRPFQDGADLVARSLARYINHQRARRRDGRRRHRQPGAHRAAQAGRDGRCRRIDLAVQRVADQSRLNRAPVPDAPASGVLAADRTVPGGRSSTGDTEMMDPLPRT